MDRSTRSRCADPGVHDPPAHAPNDESVTKVLYLALADLEKWERSIRDWSNVLGQFAVFFKDRLPNL